MRCSEGGRSTCFPRRPTPVLCSLVHSPWRRPMTTTTDTRAVPDVRGLSVDFAVDIAMIFQEPMTALSPVYTIGFQIIETLRQHSPLSPEAAKERAMELLR